MIKTEIVIPKTWRSEIQGIFVYLALCVLSVVLSSRFPDTVISGRLFSLGSFALYLHLPLLWLIPLCSYMFLVARIYNVRYIIDSKGIEARIGIISLNQRITRVRYEDVRSVETEQSLIERMLDVGTLEVSTAATGSVEVTLSGIASPREVQDMLNRERDSRHRMRMRELSQGDSYDNEVNA